jgi:hypothetical protein
MADFTLTVGTHKTAVPSATGPDGAAVAFPEGSVFKWSSSDPGIEFSDPSAASPEVTAVAPATDVVLTMDVDEAGFHHSASHTVDAVAAPVDTIGGVDFTLA